MSPRRRRDSSNKRVRAETPTFPVTSVRSECSARFFLMGHFFLHVLQMNVGFASFCFFAAASIIGLDTAAPASDLRAASASMDEARKMDLADRYLNTKATRYLLRADRAEQAATAWSKRRLWRGRAHQASLLTWKRLAPACSTLSGGATEPLRLP